MAFITLRYYSEVLGMQRELYAIVPQRSRQGEIGTQRGKALEGKCLYLLHGLSDDHTIWMRRTSIERYAEEYGLTVIMPEGDSSFYTNMKHGGDYYTHIAKELPEIAREFFGVSGRREDSLIGGLSMGGYGALKIALRETGAYSACVALSPVTDLRYLENHPRLYDAILGEGTPIPPEENPIDLIDTRKNRIFFWPSARRTSCTSLPRHSANGWKPFPIPSPTGRGRASTIGCFGTPESRRRLPGSLKKPAARLKIRRCCKIASMGQTTQKKTVIANQLSDWCGNDSFCLACCFGAFPSAVTDLAVHGRYSFPLPEFSRCALHPPEKRRTPP